MITEPLIDGFTIAIFDNPNVESTVYSGASSLLDQEVFHRPTNCDEREIYLVYAVLNTLGIVIAALEASLNDNSEVYSSLDLDDAMLTAGVAASLERIAVLKPYRGRGLALAAMQFAYNDLSNNFNCDHVQGVALPGATSFYERLVENKHIKKSGNYTYYID
mgnify:CR=1 FL=1